MNAAERPLLDLKEFVDGGYLQEVNRTVLHPLGLALAVDIADDGTYSLGPIFDSRDDLEGVVFRDGVDPEKEQNIFSEMALRYGPRINKLGYWAQGDDL